MTNEILMNLFNQTSAGLSQGNTGIGLYPAVAASITEAIGWICIKWFKDGSWVKQTV